VQEVVVLASLHAKAEVTDEVRLEHLPPERQISLKFVRRGDRATQLRIVSWALWKASGAGGGGVNRCGGGLSTGLLRAY
jgi:hypothetical protein